MRVHGEIYCEEELCIDGQVEGSIDSRGRLVVGPQGKVTATVRAMEVDVAGSVQGNVEATDKVVIRAGANIIGDVTTSGIVIEDGAYFKGGIDITKQEAPKASAPAPAAKPAPLQV